MIKIITSAELNIISSSLSAKYSLKGWIKVPYKVKTQNTVLVKFIPVKSEIVDKIKTNCQSREDPLSIVKEQNKNSKNRSHNKDKTNIKEWSEITIAFTRRYTYMCTY